MRQDAVVELSEWHMWWKTTGGRELRQVLMDSWDPIGVAGVPEATDEYDSYVGPVVRMLQEGASEGDVRRYLGPFSRTHMCLVPSPLTNRRAARAIMEWWSRAAGNPAVR